MTPEQALALKAGDIVWLAIFEYDSAGLRMVCDPCEVVKMRGHPAFPPSDIFITVRLRDNRDGCLTWDCGDFHATERDALLSIVERFATYREQVEKFAGELNERLARMSERGDHA